MSAAPLVLLAARLVAVLMNSTNRPSADITGLEERPAPELPSNPTLASALAGAPAAGCFAAGEIGPVSGESFQHAFSASVAVFAG